VPASESCVLAPVVVSGRGGVATGTGSGVGLLMTPPGDDEAGDGVGLVMTPPGDDEAGDGGVDLEMTKFSARRRSADLDAWLGLGLGLGSGSSLGLGSGLGLGLGLGQGRAAA